MRCRLCRFFGSAWVVLALATSGCILGANPGQKNPGDETSAETGVTEDADAGDSVEDVDTGGVAEDVDTGGVADDVDTGGAEGDADTGGSTVEGFSVQGGLTPSGEQGSGSSSGGFEVRGRFLRQGEAVKARDEASDSGFTVELHPLFMQ